jgi:hypothetical protein
MIEETGHPAGNLRDHFREELSMLKTISAALVAVSVLAAPAIAASTTKITQAPATKSATVNPVKKNPLNANAKMGRGHHHARHHRHHGFHKKMAVKIHKSHNLSAKHVSHSAKRG